MVKVINEKDTMGLSNNNSARVEEPKRSVKGKQGLSRMWNPVQGMSMYVCTEYVDMMWTGMMNKGTFKAVTRPSGNQGQRPTGHVDGDEIRK